MADTRERSKAVEGFTLIEMLVVILIILLLSGMLLKIAGLVSGKAARGKAVADIANLESALAEYYAEYNIYPPTSSMAYQYENSGGQPTGLKNMLDANNKPDEPGFITDSDERVVDDNRQWGQSTKGSIGYSYGLVSYLWPREQGGQKHWYDRDTERDASAKKKWAHYLDNLNVCRSKKEVSRNIGGTDFIYTNNVLTVRDPWNHDYKYECRPPHMQYKLWSVGPDGKDDTGDDINNKSFNE